MSQNILKTLLCLENDNLADKFKYIKTYKILGNTIKQLKLLMTNH